MKGSSSDPTEKKASSLRRLMLSVLCSLLFTTIVFFIITEGTLIWYMHKYGITIRSDLSEDMGLGMLLFFPFLLYAPFSLIVSFLICWKKFK